MDLLENQLEQFFGSLRKQKLSDTEVENICKPLYNQNRREIWKKCLIILMSLSLAYLVIIWFDCVQWLLTAVGRILLIQLLPYWNWPSLYNAKCLIERPVALNANNRQTPSSNSFETDRANCLLCYDIDYIPTVSNVTFSILESTYLERGLPVVVTDSHLTVPTNEFFHLIFAKSSDFLDSSHCDVSTNLILTKFFDAEIVLRKAWQLTDTSDKWFLQLRNCEFKAVKSSRNFIKRPYYYPVHLEPFYSSWLIISHNFNRHEYQEINMQGLIIMQQLTGSIDLKLSPKYPCAEDCPTLNVHLEQGEGFVFSTDLWLTKYRFIKGNHANICTVMEIDWSV